MTTQSTSTPANSPEQRVAQLAARGQRIEQPMAGGGSLVWHTWGRGTPIVLLHGGHGSWTHWLRNIETLAANHQVWAADLPGFGDSDRFDGGEDADTLWPAVDTGLRSLIVPDGGKAHLVGFSFGSMVAGFLAARVPQRVASITLAGAAAIFATVEPPPGLVSWRRLTDPDEQRAAHRQNLRALMLANDSSIDELAMYLQMTNTPRDRMPQRRLALSNVQTELQHDWQCPVKVIIGRGDVLYGERKLARIGEVLSHCDLHAVDIIDGAGHWVQFEDAERFNASVLAFVEEVEGKT